MVRILQREQKVLRKKAVEVVPREMTGEKIQHIISDMRRALDEQPDGVAIAAPQIGQSLRIFIVSEKIFELSEDIQKRREQQQDLTTRNFPHLVFINPVITKLSKQKRLLEEGCLSVRWMYGKVIRSQKATVRSYDEHGKPFQRGASGLLAQVFQHEIDHLDGVLFTDKAQDVHEVLPEQPYE